MKSRKVNGNIITADGNYFEEIALGNVTNTNCVYKFGRGKTISGKNVPLWDGNSNYVFPTSGEIVTLKSDETDDTILGDGARKIRIYGLDENWELQEEIVELNGTTLVNSVGKYIRLFRMYVYECGLQLFPYDDSTIGTNVGTITATHTGTTEPIAMILPLNGQTFMAIYTIPAGYKSLMWSAHTSEDRGANVVGKLFTKDNVQDHSAWRVKGVRDMYRNDVGINFTIPKVYSEKTDILFAINGSASGDYVSGTFELELIKL